jgi:apolipoprotein N-acyltransferase
MRMTTETDNTTLKGDAKRGGLRKIAGALLAIIGLYWLAHKAGWMPAEPGHAAIFLPIVVIAIGLFMFFGHRHRHTA